MKKRLAALALACVLLFSGCASMLERSYVSSSAHMDYSFTEDASILRAETYQGLINSILYFVNAHESTGIIRLYNYTGDVEADLANACDEVQYQDPLGAYALRSIRYDSTRILSYYEVELRIAYARSAAQMEAIREVRGVSGLRQELSRMVAEGQEKCVLLVSYFSGDTDFIEELLLLALLNDPARCQSPGGPADYSCTVRAYPDSGIRRVIEIQAPWSSTVSAAQSARYMSDLEQTAAALLEAAPPAGESYTVAELAAIVRSAAGPWDYHGSALALAALTGEAVSDAGVLLAMEYLCLQSGIEASMVDGSAGLWLIVSTPEGYRHLLPEALRAPGENEPASPAPGQETDGDGQPLLYTDEQLSALGYLWPAELHPACIAPTEGSL